MVSTANKPSDLGSTSAYVSSVWQRRAFAWYLAQGNLKARNARTSLGVLWWILNPLLLSAVYFLVFGVILGTSRGSADYLAHIVSGMFVFHYTKGSMSGGASSILSNARMIVSSRFPRMLLPISATIEEAVTFGVALLVFYAGLLPFVGSWPGLVVLLLIPMFVLHTLFNVGLAALVGRLTVRFRDLRNLLPFLTRLWLYLSPIIWTIDRLESAPDVLGQLVRLNPMFYFLNVYRAAMTGTEFVVSDLAIAAIWSVLVFVIGWTAFLRFEHRIVEHL